MRSVLLACLPLMEVSTGNRVVSDFDEVCQSHGVSGRAFRLVADPFLATTTAKPCCLPGWQNGDNEEEVDTYNNVKEGIKNGHSDSMEGGKWGDLWEQGLGVCRVDCFSRSLEQCVREGLRSCPHLSSTLAKAACFYNYITSAVPPEKLSQVFDGPGNTPPTLEDWTAQLKVLVALFKPLFLQEISNKKKP